jgi:Pin2-interacting protein X1
LRLAGSKPRYPLLTAAFVPLVLLLPLLQDKATKGHVGLGRSSMPKKVAGAHWEGTKTKIANSDDEEDSSGEEDAAGPPAVEEGPAPGGVELAQEEGLVIILPASKRHLLDSLPGSQQQQQQGVVPQAQQQAGSKAAAVADAPGSGKQAKKAKKAAAAEEAKQQAAAAAAETAAAEVKQAAAAAAPAATAGGDSMAGIKWKKAVAAALKASAKGKLKLYKLHTAIAREQAVPKAQRAAALEALTAFLQQSGKFTLKDGMVRAASA